MFRTILLLNTVTSLHRFFFFFNHSRYIHIFGPFESEMYFLMRPWNALSLQDGSVAVLEQPLRTPVHVVRDTCYGGGRWPAQ